MKEVISIPNESFDAKEQFYVKAYSENLVHHMNSSVRILGFSYGNATVLSELV